MRLLFRIIAAFFSAYVFVLLSSIFWWLRIFELVLIAIERERLLQWVDVVADRLGAVNR